jgi:CHAT domain-containing protein
VADYAPCLDCADVYFVEQVLVAELTDDVGAALAEGGLLDTACGRCGMPLTGELPVLLCSRGAELTLYYSPPSDATEPDLSVATWLLLELRARRSSWPSENPAELVVISRSDLRVMADGGAVALTRYSIPRELWDRPDPSPIALLKGDRFRRAWDYLVRAEGDVLVRTENRLAGGDLVAGIARRLAHAHIRRYQALQDPTSLTEARAAIARALRAASSSAKSSEVLADLGTVAGLEYERNGDAELIREAASAYQESLECDAGNVVAANGLGTALQRLYTWDDDPALFDAGVDALRRAVAQPGGDRAVRLNNLGSVLSSRWEATHEPSYLSEAAVALSEAVEMTPPDSPYAGARLNNLGTVRLRAHTQDGGETMLSGAVAAFSAAVDATPASDPAWPGRRANLATALWRRNGSGDRARATSLSREAAGGSADDPNGALKAACNWCRSAFELQDWAEVTEAYDRALAVSDLLLKRQLTGDARRARLRDVQGLPDLAAFAWANLGDGLAAARAIESGRARLLADTLELVAAGVEAARAAAPELVKRRERAIREIERLEQALEDNEVQGARRAAVAAEARGRRAELDDATTEIESVTPASTSLDAAIARIATHGPLVYVGCTPAGTVASVVGGEPLDAELVWATGLTSALGEEPLATVGAELAGPLSRALAVHAGKLVTFSLPAGLARVPLAAAPFIVGGTVHRLLDDHVTTLLPAAAVAALGGGRGGARRLGGVANPARTDLPALHFAATELRTAAASLPAEDDDILVGPDATVGRLLAALGRCTHLHLACHGEFRPDAPLDSCLRLADGDLSIRRMQRVERSAELRTLVLSACESAQSDATVLPDEMLGLPAACLQLGAHSVIGALWPIPDLPTGLLMARFYRHLPGEGFAAARALRRAQNWMRRATTADVIAFMNDTAGDPLLRAASRVLERKYAPDARPFSEPFTWAGFVAFGGHHQGGN